MNPIIKEINAAQEKAEVPPFKVGDGVRVHTKVREGDKERIQVFAGIVIAHKGSGMRGMSSRRCSTRLTAYGNSMR